MNQLPHYNYSAIAVSTRPPLSSRAIFLAQPRQTFSLKPSTLTKKDEALSLQVINLARQGATLSLKPSTLTKKDEAFSPEVINLALQRAALSIKV